GGVGDADDRPAHGVSVPAQRVKQAPVGSARGAFLNRGAAACASPCFHYPSSRSKQKKGPFSRKENGLRSASSTAARYPPGRLILLSRRTRISTSPEIAEGVRPTFIVLNVYADFASLSSIF